MNCKQGSAIRLRSKYRFIKMLLCLSFFPVFFRNAGLENLFLSGINFKGSITKPINREGIILIRLKVSKLQTVGARALSCFCDFFSLVRQCVFIPVGRSFYRECRRGRSIIRGNEGSPVKIPVGDNIFRRVFQLQRIFNHISCPCKAREICKSKNKNQRKNFF